MKIYTIGYGGRKPSEFIDLLKKADIKAVVDVRLSPERAFMGIYAKGKDPNKGIQGLLEREGIQYIWIPELGNPFMKDKDWKPKFQLHWEQNKDSLCSRLYELNIPFCLLCCEKYASTCHRKVISDYLADKGYEVKHLE
ncbi:MAG: DUF488 domain-containing protein [Clostridiaceae bacterium]|nr:DUF488 domain-containing protein [Clostridiaceae bacterium]